MLLRLLSYKYHYIRKGTDIPSLFVAVKTFLLHHFRSLSYNIKGALIFFGSIPKMLRNSCERRTLYEIKRKNTYRRR